MTKLHKFTSFKGTKASKTFLKIEDVFSKKAERELLASLEFVEFWPFYVYKSAKHLLSIHIHEIDKYKLQLQLRLYQS